MIKVKKLKLFKPLKIQPLSYAHTFNSDEFEITRPSDVEFIIQYKGGGDLYHVTFNNVEFWIEDGSQDTTRGELKQSDDISKAGNTKRTRAKRAKKSPVKTDV